MKVNKSCLLLTVCAAALMAVSPAQAALGLAGKAPQAVGALVKKAASDIYAGMTDPAAAQRQLAAILNEAAATGDEEAIRYAIVAVMLAGGPDNLNLSKQAIENSNVFTAYQDLADGTMAEAERLMTGREPPPRETGKPAEKPQGPPQEKPGRPAEDMPPQTENIFDQFPPPSDGDIPATPI